MADSSARRLDSLLRHFSLAYPPLAPHMVNRCSHTSSLGGPVVIGSMVLDIHAYPFSNELQPGTTTPGKVRYVRGGVGRNVAECMSKLGMAPFLISVVGQDMAGDVLLAHWQSLGLETDGIRRCLGAATPVVSAIFDADGELAGAVADTHILEENLTPEWIRLFESHIRCASFLLLDANLNPAALEAACNLAKEVNLPIWFEPVSVSKSVRFSTISNYITYASPNEAELMAMAVGADCKPENVLKHDDGNGSVNSLIQQLQPYILAILQKGIVFVVLTLGRHGVVLCSKSLHPNQRMTVASNDVRMPESPLNRIAADVQMLCHQLSEVSYVHFPALPASIVSLSGAGDCFVAGALSALCRHQGLFASIACGIAVARQAIQSELNVPLNLSQANLTVDAQSVLASAKQLILR